jgi:hypothetical protein
MSHEPKQSFWGTWGKPPRASGFNADPVDARAGSVSESPASNRASHVPAGSAYTSAAAAAPARTNILPQERRLHPRFKCEGNMELTTVGCTTKTWATFTDISSSGCYVEMMTTFPVGTKLDLRLGMNGFLVNGAAVVRATYPFLGMGIEFTALSPQARKQLDDMIDSLLSTSIRRTEAPAKNPMSLPPVSEPGAVIDALVLFFETNPTLSAEQFARLVADSQQRST